MLNIVIKLIGSSTNSNNDIILFESARKFVCSDQVEVVVIWVSNNWDSNIICPDNLINLIIDVVTFSCSKLKWWSSEKLIALSFNLFVGEASFLKSQKSLSFIFLINELLSFNNLSSCALDF